MAIHITGSASQKSRRNGHSKLTDDTVTMFASRLESVPEMLFKLLPGLRLGPAQ